MGGSGGAGKVGDREKVMILTKTRGRNGRRRERETAEGEKGQERQRDAQSRKWHSQYISLSKQTNKTNKKTRAKQEWRESGAAEDGDSYRQRNRRKQEGRGRRTETSLG